MPGPAPKHPSIRARRNNSKAGFTSLPAEGRAGSAPTWPLGPDARLASLKDLSDDKVASLTAELAAEEDGRKKGGIRRRLDTAEQQAALLALQLEQAKDAELELWALLWSTPQATMWDDSPAFARMLAQFVRWNVKAEHGDKDAAVEARLRGKEFGLTPLTLLGLKQEIEATEAAEEKGKERRERTKPAPKKRRGDPRTNLHAV